MNRELPESGKLATHRQAVLECEFPVREARRHTALVLEARGAPANTIATAVVDCEPVRDPVLTDELAVLDPFSAHRLTVIDLLDTVRPNLLTVRLLNSIGVDLMPFRLLNTIGVHLPPVRLPNTLGVHRPVRMLDDAVCPLRVAAAPMLLHRHHPWGCKASAALDISVASATASLNVHRSVATASLDIGGTTASTCVAAVSGARRRRGCNR